MHPGSRRELTLEDVAEEVYRLRKENKLLKKKLALYVSKSSKKAT